MTAQELLESLVEVSQTVDLSKLQIVIRLSDSDEDMHMGGVASVGVESGCTDTPALILDCNQDPENCQMEDDE